MSTSMVLPFGGATMGSVSTDKSETVQSDRPGKKFADWLNASDNDTTGAEANPAAGSAPAATNQPKAARDDKSDAQQGQAELSGQDSAGETSSTKTDKENKPAASQQQAAGMMPSLTALVLPIMPVSITATSKDSTGKSGAGAIAGATPVTAAALQGTGALTGMATAGASGQTAAAVSGQTGNILLNGMDSKEQPASAVTAANHAALTQQAQAAAADTGNPKEAIGLNPFVASTGITQGKGNVAANPVTTVMQATTDSEKQQKSTAQSQVALSAADTRPAQAKTEAQATAVMTAPDTGKISATAADTQKGETSLSLEQHGADLPKTANAAQGDNAANGFAGIFNQFTTHGTPMTAEANATVPQQPAVQDPNNIMAQIIDKANLTNRAESSEMVIQLKPEHLGELTLKVAVENGGGVSATFHSNNPEVRGVIEASLQQLKQEMANSGIKVEHVGVYAGMGQFSPDSQQQNARQPFLKTPNRKNSQEYEQISVEPVPDNKQNGYSLSGVDYRI
ncbi:flagellar hook-length control protein flik [Lucifera butyrica]|uniref:Flagellar hook-length control protein flik n=1 Tax=Lucifera butyrica TaxID=1351585 RepID=A0A498RDF1_9FIRM|nr:flagellar hook-length control protein FliK [Lucifera butyrica]VBB08093.1 flagellar hook-length control protein flik [Lucifera butyrica]